jgi:hypothetical protein
MALVFPGQEWWGHPWHWVPDSSHLAIGGVGRVQGVGPLYSEYKTPSLPSSVWS